MLDLESVRAFVVFSEQMNFTQAARQLHLSQPALHARVQKLASELGVPLYQRHGRRLVLTQAGEEVVRFGRETLNKTLDILHTSTIFKTKNQSLYFRCRTRQSPLHLTSSMW